MLTETEPRVSVAPDRAWAEQTLRRLHARLAPGALAEDGLITGKLGQVVYYAGLYRHWGDDGLAARATALLKDVLAGIGAGPAHVRPSTGLSRGLAGLGMVLDLLYRAGVLERDDHLAQYLRGVDAFLRDHCIRQIGEQNLDYLHASAGAINYLARRVPHNDRVAGYLDDIVAALLRVGVADENGLRFRNFGSSGIKDGRTVNLSLAHGMTGILLSLLGVHEAGVARDRIGPVIGAGLHFLLPHRQHPAGLPPYANVFPNSVDEGVPPGDPENRSRYEPFLGWCRGDMGQLLLLHRAAARLGNPEWDRIAAEVGAHALARCAMAGTHVQDAFLCHGAGGLAQIYRRLHESTGLDQYRDGYGFWLGHALRATDARLQAGTEIGGAGGLMYGWTGVGLVLLSAVLADDYPWDGILLLS